MIKFRWAMFLPAALISALLISGCGADGTNEMNSLKREQVLVQVINEELPGTVGVPDQDIIDLGESICERLDNGDDIYDIGVTGLEAGFTPYETGFIIGASISALCPEHEDMVDNA